MINKRLSEEFEIKEWQVKNIIELIDNDNSLAFIAHYRKQKTGNLDNRTLIKFKQFLKYLKELEEKKTEIINKLSSKGEIDNEIKELIENSETFTEIEDLYEPYAEKDGTPSTIAKSKGLEPLANIIRFQQTKIPIEEIAKDYINEEKGVNTVEDAIRGAEDIIAKKISENIEFKDLIRKISYEEGELEVEAVDKNEESEYELYYDHKESIIDIANHRVLAINRGTNEGFLKVKITTPKDDIVQYLIRHTLISEDYGETYNELTRPYIEEAVYKSYNDIIAPFVERDIRKYIVEKAEKESIEVLSENLKNLLMQKPIRGKVVMGLNPSLYSTSKIAIVDEKGNVLKTDTVYINDIEEFKSTISYLIKEFDVKLIAIGSFTDSNKFEEVISEIIKGTEVKYAIINQTGASDYSQSVFGQIEFPDYEVGHRIAISIAKRLQDPLTELVKIDPKSIGVGQYQHDMEEKKLIEAITNVIDVVVNSVGVDINTASISLLVHVAGIDSVVATNIIRYVKENGPLTTREDFLKIDEFEKETFEQSAGFLRVYNSINRLDETKIHPESYNIAQKFLEKLNLTIDDMGTRKVSLVNVNFKQLAEELNTDQYTLEDIAIQIKNPEIDPRDNMPHVLLRDKSLSINDLKVGMVMEGTIRNVVDFGAFVDLGVYHDGLIHISKMNKGKFINHPTDIVNVGDRVKVKILEIDLSKNRIQLYLM
ncbi:helix-hairpin-helix domain-containing protein [Methanobrevibacter filiformis]|nr:Tex-like N-terminal domain-containing protein [Methanobrevibacter filiformis]